MILARLNRSSFALAAALSLAVALPACAKSAMSTARSTGGDASNDAEAPLSSDMDGALAVLDRAERDLTAALGPAAPSGAGPGGVAARRREEAKKADAPAAAEPPPPAAQSAPEPLAAADAARPATRGEGAVLGGAAEERQDAAPCERACRALGSMRRATDHLCGLAGDADARCESARERVRSAGERVQAACPACQHG
jgi:hypothetical protein